GSPGPTPMPYRIADMARSFLLASQRVDSCYRHGASAFAAMHNSPGQVMALAQRQFRFGGTDKSDWHSDDSSRSRRAHVHHLHQVKQGGRGVANHEESPPELLTPQLCGGSHSRGAEAICNAWYPLIF